MTLIKDKKYMLDEYYTERARIITEKERQKKRRFTFLCKRYWKHIQENGIAGRDIRELGLFTAQDYSYINKMNKQGMNH